MADIDKHMKGYEKEAALKEMHRHPEVRKRLYKWHDFMTLARVLNPGLCEEAFKRRPCERTLRYIGFDNFEEPFRSEERMDPYIYGNVYHAVDFNGATYTIKETGDCIGSAYFEVMD
jgi:hypothetical protein